MARMRRPNPPRRFSRRPIVRLRIGESVLSVTVEHWPTMRGIIASQLNGFPQAMLEEVYLPNAEHHIELLRMFSELRGKARLTLL